MRSRVEATGGTSRGKIPVGRLIINDELQNRESNCIEKGRNEQNSLGRLRLGTEKDFYFLCALLNK